MGGRLDLIFGMAITILFLAELYGWEPKGDSYDRGQFNLGWPYRYSLYTEHIKLGRELL